MITTTAFYIFSAILLGSALMVVSGRNPVHSVLFLILAFFNAAALFLIAGAEFLAMILVIVYVGAVAVLFLFVIMMLDIDFVALREGFQRYAPVGATVGAVLFFELLSVLLGWQISGGTFISGLNRSAIHIQNTRAIGQILYTDYLLLFQISGLILLTAMIGAIVLTHRNSLSSRKQSITRQQNRRVAATLKVVDVRVGAGMLETGIYRAKSPEAVSLAGSAQENNELQQCPAPVTLPPLERR